MLEAASTDAWVFHAGALGDFVLTWPLIRALSHRYQRVHVVADASKAALAASCIGGNVVPHDGQRRDFTCLWSGEPAPGATPVMDASLVVNFVADPRSNPRWPAAARQMFPRAGLRHVGPPASDSRRIAWQELGAERWGAAPTQPRRGASAAGPGVPPTVLCHVGAGSASKRWPMTCWSRLAGLLPERATFIAGEVEAEQFTADERALFDALGGRLCETLHNLAGAILDGDIFVGADSGPTHLAAQLGLPTVAIFGPTDPKIWAPVGPAVRIIAPAPLSPMTWLAPERLYREIGALL